MKKHIKKLLKYLTWTKSTQITYQKLKRRVFNDSQDTMDDLLEVFLKYNLIEIVSSDGKNTIYTPSIKSDFVVYNGILIKYLGKTDCVNLPEGIVTIGKSKFTKGEENELLWSYDIWNCAKTLPTQIVLSSTVKNIDSNAFAGLPLKEFVMPNTVTTVGHSVFSHCLNLSKVMLSSSINMIEAHTFCNCQNLMEVVFPRSIKEVKSHAFIGCNNLKTIYFDGTQQEWNSIVVDEYNQELKKATVCYCK